ncbi:MAG: trypsin-like peptidase domain-containing protein [Chloroflexota bacterium]
MRYKYPEEIKPIEPPAPPAPRPRLGMRFAQSLLLVAAGVLIAAAMLAAYTVINPPGPRITQRDIDNAVAQALASATPPPPLGALVYEAVRPSVVSIQTRSLSVDGKSEGARGTGVIIDDQGTILTSLHVIVDALDIKVIFADGSESEAVVINKDPSQDLAALRAKVLPDNMQPATLGNSRSLFPGEEAFVIGNPFGITGSFSAGVVSGLNRTFKPPKASEPLKGLIQFDAAVNPGNSGGPLLNRNGEVVGIVTGLVNPTEQDVFIGIGFAVPIEQAGGAIGGPPY